MTSLENDSPSEVKLAGRYRLTARMARGALADSWECEDEVLGRCVAAKILRSRLATEPAVRRLFREEAVATAQLVHANIVSVFDTGEHNGAPFIVTEYLGGGSLRDRLKRGPLPAETVCRIGIQICAALGHAHKAGIVHGDMRPENVLFTEAGHVKVSDFAIAKAAWAGSGITNPAGAGRTDAYTPPEHRRHQGPDIRSDLYSVGVILYECATGTTPAAAAAERPSPQGAAERPPIPGPRDLEPSVPRELDLAIIGALQRDPAARFQTARALEKTLRRVTGSTEDPPPPAAIPIAGPSQPRRPEPGPTQPRTPVRPAEETEAVIPAAAAPPVSPALSSRRESFLKSEGRWLLPAALVMLAAAALVLFIPTLRSGIESVVAPQRGLPPAPLEVAAIDAYDPPPGDGVEGNRRLGFAIDGDPQTSWSTSSYSRPDLGGLKDGVGVFVDLGRERELQGLRVRSVTGGWDGVVRVSDDGVNWSEPGASVTVTEDHTFDVSGSHRYWMIWITNLVLTEGEGTANNPYAVAIREITPLAAS